MSASRSSSTESSKKCSSASASSHVLIWDKHAEFAQSNLKLCVDDETYCDVVFITRLDGKRIPAHRLILHTTSLYFQTMFAAKLKESSEKEIVIDNMRSDILKLIIDFCYYGKITITVDNVEELLTAAELMQFKIISKECAEFMLRNLDESNCLGIAHCLKPYEFPQVSEKVNAYINTNFIVVTKFEEYLKIKIDDLQELLSRQDISVDSEDTLFMALKNWVQHDWNNRQSYVPKLLALINLEKLSKQCFWNEAVRWLGMNTAPFDNIFAPVMEYHLFENVNPQPGIELTGQNASRRSDTSASQLISVSQSIKEKTICIKMINSDGPWELLSKKSKNLFYRAITHSEEKIFILDAENNLEYFDIIRKEWIHLSSTVRSNEWPPLAYYKGQVYVIGRTSSKAWNISTKAMTSVSQMKYLRNGASIEVLDDKIYVIGGKSKKVEYYEPDKNIWTECPSLNNISILSNVLFFNGFLYSICFRTAERYKPGDDHWELIASLPPDTYCTSACVYKNSIIVVCKSNDENKWFKYNEAENKWNEIDISYPDNDTICYLFCVNQNNIND